MISHQLGMEAALFDSWAADPPVASPFDMPEPLVSRAAHFLKAPRHPTPAWTPFGAFDDQNDSPCSSTINFFGRLSSEFTYRWPESTTAGSLHGGPPSSSAVFYPAPTVSDMSNHLGNPCFNRPLKRVWADAGPLSNTIACWFQEASQRNIADYNPSAVSNNPHVCSRGLPGRQVLTGYYFTPEEGQHGKYESSKRRRVCQYVAGRLRRDERPSATEPFAFARELKSRMVRSVLDKLFLLTECGFPEASTQLAIQCAMRIWDKQLLPLSIKQVTACFVIGVKLAGDTRRQVPPLSWLTSRTRLSAKVLHQAELSAMAALDWAPLRGWLR